MTHIRFPRVVAHGQTKMGWEGSVLEPVGWASDQKRVNQKKEVAAVLIVDVVNFAEISERPVSLQTESQ
ncbi:hypothetical protein GCM10010862_53210 [Devosia nitrariae]|uniref:Guanylate cyclase domain-containing protein n=1 Tax=Devosia nitrariae TaxID=2071872 RepID=A0ABQ5WDM5_9HYPH|nr:hypothetical protein GCM10010862_53210 [Devosia nitrariae]